MVWAFHMLPAQGTASAQSVAGGGVKGYVNGSMLFVGRQSWVQQQVSSQGSSSLQHPPDSNVSAGACVLSPDPGCSAVWVGGKVRRQLFCLVSLLVVFKRHSSEIAVTTFDNLEVHCCLA